MTYTPLNFFVPGAQKAGTTYLCKYLAKHPQVCLTEPKEPLFFTKAVTPESLEEYARSCLGKRAQADGVRYVGDGSTSYFQSELALSNIMTYAAEQKKAIICLRQPVAKAVSFYMHLFQRKHITGRERIIDLTHPARSVYISSAYAKAAKAWIDAFGRRNILFLKFDLLLQSPGEFLNAATRFLKIDPIDEAAVSARPINMGYKVRARHDFYEPLARKKHKPLPDWQTLPRIYRQELELLQAYFLPDIKATAKLTGLDLSDWTALPEEFAA